MSWVRSLLVGIFWSLGEGESGPAGVVKPHIRFLPIPNRIFTTKQKGKTTLVALPENNF
jgi:hypothetical protein